MPMATPSLAPSSRRAVTSPARAPAGSGSRARSASRPASTSAPASSVRRRVSTRSAISGQLPRRLPGRHRSGVDEDVGAIEIAARGAPAGLCDVERPVGERLEQRAHEVLGGQALDVLGVAHRQRGLVGDGLQQLLVLSGERAHARAHRHEGAHLLAIVAQRSPRLDTRIGERARRVERDQLERAVLAVAQPQLRGVAGQQPPHARRDDAIELLAPPDRDDALAQLGEVREGIHTQPRLLVEPRVLDRARHERRGVHEEVEHALVELARGHGVEHDDAQHLARPGGHRDGDHRLEVLLLELGHVLHARVRQRVLADERGLAGPCDPACQPLVEGELDLAHHVGVDA